MFLITIYHTSFKIRSYKNDKKNHFLELRSYLTYQEEQRKILDLENRKYYARTYFYENIEFKSILIVLYSIVWIWGITGNNSTQGFVIDLLSNC